jgi:predicted nucleic-acid-binding protein
LNELNGLDTNVLVRYTTQDNPAQTRVATELLEEADDRQDRFYLSTILVCELTWTLRGSPYHFDRAAISAVLEDLLTTELFEVQDRHLIQKAVLGYRHGRADFPDYLIGLQNRQAGCESTLTFDRKLKGADGFSLLA